MSDRIEHEPVYSAGGKQKPPAWGKNLEILIQNLRKLAYDRSSNNLREWERMDLTEAAYGLEFSTPNFFCMFTQWIYGASGNELPPPVVKQNMYTYKSLPAETKEEFTDRMKTLGDLLNANAKKAPVNSYSRHDVWGWSIIDIVDEPVPGFKNGL